MRGFKESGKQKSPLIQRAFEIWRRDSPPCISPMQYKYKNKIHIYPIYNQHAVRFEPTQSNRNLN